jgi:hypothetical protein
MNVYTYTYMHNDFTHSYTNADNHLKQHKKTAKIHSDTCHRQRLYFWRSFQSHTLVLILYLLLDTIFHTTFIMKRN